MKHTPWEKMIESQRQPYYEVAMNAMGYLFGVGEWEKKACNQPEVVMFIQVK